MKKILRKIVPAFLFVFGMGTTLNAQYCTTTGPSSTADTNVEGVTLAGESTSINHIGCPGVSGLNLQLGQVADLLPGETYDINIIWGTCGGSYGNAGSAWIDFNGNGVYETSELIASISYGGGYNSQNYSFTVPNDATVGLTRMRVVQQEGGSLPLSPCVTFTWGSSTDYSIEILSPPFGGNVSVVSNLTCFGDSNGSLTVNYWGAVEPVTYLWDNGATTQTVTGLDEGFYCVTAIDADLNEFTECGFVANLATEALDVYARSTADWICSDGTGLLIIDSIVGGAPTSLSCGISGFNCVDVDTVQTPGSTLYTSFFPSPFANSWDGTRNQMLYTAAELIAAGIQPGNISGLAIEISALNGTNTSRENWTIKIGCTGAASLAASFDVVNPIEVFYPTNITVATGWNYFEFDESYYWDGTSNLIIETCYFNPGFTYTSNPSTAYSTTAFTSVAYNYADNTNVCSTSGFVYTSTNRPILRLFNCNVEPDFPYIYSWNNGSVADSTYVPAGDYTLTVTDGVGCVKTQDITINASQPVNINDETMCKNNPFVYSASPGFNSYLWNNGETTQSITLNNGGTMTVEAVDSLGCVSNDVAFVTTLASPILSASSSDAMLGHDGAIYLTIYGNAYPFVVDWDVDGTGDNDDTENQFNLAPGSYNVVVTDTNGCWATLSIVVNTQLGLGDNSNIFKVYPNPTSDFIYIQPSTIQGENVYGELVDINGKLIELIPLAGLETATVDLTYLESGIYFINIVVDNEKTSLKVIKN